MEGAEFPDLASAETEAAQSARDLIVDELRRGKPVPVRWQAEIALEDGTVVSAIPFAALAYRQDEIDLSGDRAHPLILFHALAAQFARAQAIAKQAQRITEEIKMTVNDMRAKLR